MKELMILVDFSQIISACIFVGDAHECAKNPSTDSKNMIKHSIINSVRANFVLHKKQYGQMVLCCDSGSWRYDVYPQYKHSRKEKRKTDKSGIDWVFVNEVKQELISDLKVNFPFPLIISDKAEGDDCIAVLSKLINNSEEMEEPDIFGNIEKQKILIVSSDNDNYQLHSLGNHVKQWSPALKKLVKSACPILEYMTTKMVKGESSDGIPSIKSSDNIFVLGERQKPISAKYLQSFFDAKNPIDACQTDDERKNYVRNEQLISYDKIPTVIADAIISCYNDEIIKKHSKLELMTYLSKNRMSNILSNIQDFYL